MGHQYIAQLTQNKDSRVRDAVFGNVGNIVSFRIGVDDAELIAKQLAPQVSEYDLINIEKYNAYVKMLIDNTATDTFNIKTLELPANPNLQMVSLIKNYSRDKYGRPIEEVKREIVERSKIGQLGKEKAFSQPDGRLA